MISKLIDKSLAIACVSLIGLLVGPVLAQETAPPSTPPDNTKVNKPDRQKSEPTADQAKNNHSDREMMQQIRRAVVADGIRGRSRYRRIGFHSDEPQSGHESEIAGKRLSENSVTPRSRSRSSADSVSLPLSDWLRRWENPPK